MKCGESPEIGSERDCCPKTCQRLADKTGFIESPGRILRMKSKRHTTEQIIGKLRRADIELGKGRKVPEVCKLLSITEQTYYRWRQKYGGMAPEMAKELKALQQENSRLKKVVANQALDMEILREAARGNW